MAHPRGGTMLPYSPASTDTTSIVYQHSKKYWQSHHACQCRHCHYRRQLHVANKAKTAAGVLSALDVGAILESLTTSGGHTSHNSSRNSSRTSATKYVATTDHRLRYYEATSEDEIIPLLETHNTLELKTGMLADCQSEDEGEAESEGAENVTSSLWLTVDLDHTGGGGSHTTPQDAVTTELYMVQPDPAEHPAEHRVTSQCSSDHVLTGVKHSSLRTSRSGLTRLRSHWSLSEAVSDDKDRQISGRLDKLVRLMSLDAVI